MFGGDAFATPHDAIAKLGEQFADWRAGAPWKLLAGLGDHADSIATRPMKWQQFRAKLAAVSLTAGQQTEACDRP